MLNLWNFAQTVQTKADYLLPSLILHQPMSVQSSLSFPQNVQQRIHENSHIIS